MHGDLEQPGEPGQRTAGRVRRGQRDGDGRAGTRRRRSLGDDLALQMPVAGEPVERAADDQAVPADLIRLGLRVIGPVDRLGEARQRPVGLRRALVEVDLVPPRRPRPQVAGQLLAGRKQPRRGVLRPRSARPSPRSRSRSRSPRRSPAARSAWPARSRWRRTPAPAGSGTRPASAPCRCRCETACRTCHLRVSRC